MLEPMMLGTYVPPAERTGVLGSFTQSTGLWSILAGLFSRANFLQTTRLVLSGVVIESGRRLYKWLVDRIRIAFGVSGRFSQGDPTYDWLMQWISETDAWKSSRAFRVSAKSTQRKWTLNDNALALDENADYVPGFHSPLLFRWRGYWVDIGRSVAGNQPNQYGQGSKHQLRVTIYTRDVTVMSALVDEARECYQEHGRPHVVIHLNDMMIGLPHRGLEWNTVKTKLRRPLHTLALEPGVLEGILTDARDFLGADDWYTAVGIPHRRGYLLYGPPGTGKTSTIYAIAGELGLEIYSLSLSSGHIDDGMLMRMASAVPRNSILLIEDIDCAFSSRDDDDDDSDMTRHMPMMAPFMRGRRGSGGSSVTLSGLLNMLDGVGSDEGRIFFATTNHVDRLDSALLRPGRIDRKLEYKLATQDQARALFDRFFPASRFGPSPYFASVEEKEASELESLAAAFTEAVPENEFSVAEIQGYLLSCKSSPKDAARRARDWVENERQMREQKKERERERQAKKAARKATKNPPFALGHGTLGMPMGMPVPTPSLAPPQSNGLAANISPDHNPGPLAMPVPSPSVGPPQSNGLAATISPHHNPVFEMGMPVPSPAPGPPPAAPVGADPKFALLAAHWTLRANDANGSPLPETSNSPAATTTSASPNALPAAWMEMNGIDEPLASPARPVSSAPRMSAIAETVDSPQALHAEDLEPVPKTDAPVDIFTPTSGSISPAPSHSHSLPSISFPQPHPHTPSSMSLDSFPPSPAPTDSSYVDITPPSPTPPSPSLTAVSPSPSISSSPKLDASPLSMEMPPTPPKPAGAELMPPTPGKVRAALSPENAPAPRTRTLSRPTAPARPGTPSGLSSPRVRTVSRPTEPARPGTPSGVRRVTQSKIPMAEPGARPPSRAATGPGGSPNPRARTASTMDATARPRLPSEWRPGS